MWDFEVTVVALNLSQKDWQQSGPLVKQQVMQYFIVVNLWDIKKLSDIKDAPTYLRDTDEDIHFIWVHDPQSRLNPHDLMAYLEKNWLHKVQGTLSQTKIYWSRLENSLHS